MQDGADISLFVCSTVRVLQNAQDDSIKNDYSTHYVATEGGGERPQNFLRNTQLEGRFDEYADASNASS